MDFYRYHALGNDYIVIDPNKTRVPLTHENIRLICDRHLGSGSDGILYGPLEDDHGNISLRIFNPDGSEAEKSGNGVRIFARYLIDAGYRQIRIPFEIQTKGGTVQAKVINEKDEIHVQMGMATFQSNKIPVAIEDQEAVHLVLPIEDEELKVTCVSIGNPHCVIPMETISKNKAIELGPKIENHPLFPNRTNIQLLQVLDRHNIRIEIWERGAGYTLSSGSSSCAAAAAAYRLGLTDHQLTVHMPGGKLQVNIDRDYRVDTIGSVTSISSGYFTDQFREQLNG